MRAATSGAKTGYPSTRLVPVDRPPYPAVAPTAAIE